MPRRRKKFENKENIERWLLTYADLITLLLAFFVVMYSMSQIDNKKFGKVSDALNSILQGGSSGRRYQFLSRFRHVFNLKHIVSTGRYRRIKAF